STVRWDFVAFARLYGELGVGAGVYDPSRFSTRGGQLYADGRHIEIIVRDTLDELVPPFVPSAPARVLREALVESLVTFGNPTPAAIADQKALLELLSDPDPAVIPEADRAFLAEILPWTRVLRPRTTENDRGEGIDLVPWVLENRAALVLKPSEGYGGF